METKTCKICKESKLFSAFAVSKGYVANQCRDCENAKRREKSAKKKAGLIVVAVDPISNILCEYCHLELSRTLFRPQSRQCSDCLKIKRLEYTESEHGKEKQAEWYQNNRESVAKQQAEWSKQNRSKINERYNQRYHTDSEFRFKELCRSRIRVALKNRGEKKSGKTVAYLNCAMPWLMEWLKFCFTPEMTMENHATYWHMDHVIPVNTFDLSDPDPEKVKLCFSWYNLSPLPASENISKHDTINVQQIRKHVQNLICFNKLYNIDKYFDLCARHLI